MNRFAVERDLEARVTSLLGRSEMLTYYRRARGWGFLMTWAHRLTGLILVTYMGFHIYTLCGLYDPARFEAKMKLLDNVFFSFLEWALAVPVIFHAFNGTRLLLYEIFRVRANEAMMRWVFALGTLYVLTLGLFMAMGNQQISAGVFWFVTTVAGALAAVVVYRKLWPTGNMPLWKLQRVSGAFLLPMVSGHMFFMHLTYDAGHRMGDIVARISSYGMKLVDVVFVLVVFFHGAFGLYSIIGDYVEVKPLRMGLSFLTSFVMGLFAYAGVKLILSI